MAKKAPAHVENPITTMKISVSRPFLSLGPCPCDGRSASDGRRMEKESENGVGKENDDRSCVDGS